MLMQVNRDSELTSATVMLKHSTIDHGRAQRNRVHRNSIQRSPMVIESESPPPIPATNVKQRDLDRMAGFQNRLDNRLSQPKLTSIARSNGGSVVSLRASIDEPVSPLPEPVSPTKKQAASPSKKQSVSPSTQQVYSAVKMKQAKTNKNADGQLDKSLASRRNNSMIPQNISMGDLQAGLMNRINKPAKGDEPRMYTSKNRGKGMWDTT